MKALVTFGIVALFVAAIVVAGDAWKGVLGLEIVAVIVIGALAIKARRV